MKSVSGIIASPRVNADRSPQTRLQSRVTRLLLMNFANSPFVRLHLGATPRIYLAWGGAVMSPSESQRNPRTAWRTQILALLPGGRAKDLTSAMDCFEATSYQLHHETRREVRSAHRLIDPPASHRRWGIAELERAAFSIGRSSRPHSPPHWFRGFRCAPPTANKIRGSAASSLRFMRAFSHITNHAIQPSGWACRCHRPRSHLSSPSTPSLAAHRSRVTTLISTPKRLTPPEQSVGGELCGANWL